MTAFLRQDLSNLSPYTIEQIPYTIKLDANESPFDLPQNVRISLATEIMGGLRFNRYPDSDANHLREKLASNLGLHKNQLLVGTGSDELLQIIINTFVSKNDTVLCPYPSFGMYAVFTRIAGGVPIDVPLDENFAYNLDRFFHCVKKYAPKIVFLCSPNNPTGNLVNKEDILELLKGYNGIVVLDEAYVEFSGTSLIRELVEYPNAIVLRTFSKAFGLAGLRVGYLAANKELAEDLYRVKPPYNISNFSQRAACIMLDHTDEIKERVSEIISSREEMFGSFAKSNGLKPYPSEANFILVRFPDAKRIYNRLLENGILVRNFQNNVPLGDCLRITVGEKHENLNLIISLQQIMKEGLNRS
jgi:histidinol-phosphate aminotransferase